MMERKYVYSIHLIFVQEKKFAHALVAGIERYPLKVTKRMSAKKIERRSKVKPFAKFINYNHVLPTRYMLDKDIDLKQVVTEDKMSTKETRKQMKKDVRKLFNEKYDI